jgi:hypothetical protein
MEDGSRREDEGEWKRRTWAWREDLDVWRKENTSFDVG